MFLLFFSCQTKDTKEVDMVCILTVIFSLFFFFQDACGSNKIIVIGIDMLNTDTDEWGKVRYYKAYMIKEMDCDRILAIMEVSY